MSRPDALGSEDVRSVAGHARCCLVPSAWAEPDGYPDSLALCVLDAIWSIGVRYSGVVNVVSHIMSTFVVVRAPMVVTTV